MESEEKIIKEANKLLAELRKDGRIAMRHVERDLEGHIEVGSKKTLLLVEMMNRKYITPEKIEEAIRVYEREQVRYVLENYVRYTGVSQLGSKPLERLKEGLIRNWISSEDVYDQQVIFQEKYQNPRARHPQNFNSHLQVDEYLRNYEKKGILTHTHL